MVKSILKPSIPLSPPKPIPPHPNSRKGSPRAKAGSSPARPGSASTNGQSGLRNSASPFGRGSPRKNGEANGNQSSVELKTEEQQQAEARERERKEAIERRDARRKSLANRRVSFAPEATLHTWDVVELPEDATSSSEATNSTRRASAMSSLPPSSPHPPPEQQEPDSDPVEEPATPPKAEVQVATSPAHQREMHKKKRRRSSKMHFSNSEDMSSSPASSFGSDDTHQSIAAVEASVIDGSDSDEEDRDLVARDETVTGVDNDDLTSLSSASQNSAGPSTNSSGTLDAALRQATIQAGNQDLMLDDDGDVSMDMADQEVTNAFKPWVRQHPSSTLANQASLLDQDDMDPFFQNTTLNNKTASSREEMTMEMTEAIGRIMPRDDAQASPTHGRRKSMGRRASIARRRSSGGSSAAGDETMELTTVFGAIKQAPEPPADVTGSINGDEDMSMELTTVLGGGIKAVSLDVRRESISSAIGEDMDMTAPIGRVLSPVTERTEPTTDEDTLGMDITTAMGAILPDGLKTDDKHTAKLLMEAEVDHGQLTRSPLLTKKSDTPDLLKATEQAPKADEVETPSRMGGGSRLSIVRQSPRTRASPRTTTPVKKPATPSKQVTPQPERPSTPNKTPLSKNIAMRKRSPKRLFKPNQKSPVAKSPKPDAKNPATKSPKSAQKELGFKNDEATGSSVPSIVLTPRQRSLSGIGIDQPGMGSPKVAEKLDRRGSIGETASEFTPLKKPSAVRFEDPRELERELDKELAEEHRRESGRGILEMGANAGQQDKDVTANLKDMIQSLTPKKNKLRGRKSLHVGAARGLLGKRPIELDEDDEDATPKKRRGVEKSPVKSVHLPAPPSKEQTTGRSGRPPRASLREIDGNTGTPTTHVISDPNVTTPKDQRCFTDIDITEDRLPTTLNEQLAGVPVEASPPDDDRIYLSDFLNMTSIRFMELTTTKRRHTIAPDRAQDGTPGPAFEIGNALADRVAAGACTLPMLELYQHSCRELKRYIAEGRDIVREIEQDTYDENPALFREYLAAAPDVRALMDNQFKNVKAHARLRSRAMWYEWRGKLLEGLRAGLDRIAADLADDEQRLEHQEGLLEPVVPELVERHEQLTATATQLQTRADELANCDQEELQAARERLVALDDESEAKRAALAAAMTQTEQTEDRLEAAAERRVEYQGEIREAERVREECRGWSGAEVAALRGMRSPLPFPFPTTNTSRPDSVKALEKTLGWTIASASGTDVTLAHRRILLTLFPAAFAPHAPRDAASRALPTALRPPSPASSCSCSARGCLASCSRARRWALRLPWPLPGPRLRSARRARSMLSGTRAFRSRYGSWAMQSLRACVACC